MRKPHEPTPPGQPTAPGICRNFRQKVMYLSGGGPDLEQYNPASTAHCWCLRTLDVFGPDDQRVDPLECRPGRSCFESY